MGEHKKDGPTHKKDAIDFIVTDKKWADVGIEIQIITMLCKFLSFFCTTT